MEITEVKVKFNIVEKIVSFIRETFHLEEESSHVEQTKAAEAQTAEASSKKSRRGFSLYKLLTSKWSFVVTLSLVTLTLLVVTISIGLRNEVYNQYTAVATQQEKVMKTKSMYRVAAEVEQMKQTAAAEAAKASLVAAAPVVESQQEAYVEDLSWEADYAQAAGLPDVGGDYYSAGELRFMGEIYSGGYRWTWYSQNVLPGGGLQIPGRHVDENGFVCDENDRICLASVDLPWGTVVNTPFGKEGCVYDCGCPYGTLDVYVDF